MRQCNHCNRYSNQPLAATTEASNLTEDRRMKNIETIVAAHLTGATVTYLENIVDHGIHNLTNDFHGDNAVEYEAFANEFLAQALEKLTEGAQWKSQRNKRETDIAQR